MRHAQLFSVALLVIVSAIGLRAVSPIVATEQGDWIKESGVRLENAADPFVMSLPNGGYRMYYPGAGGIVSAYSEDGLNWSRESGVRVPCGEFGGPESMVMGASVIQLENGSYRMYYCGKSGLAVLQEL